MNEINGYRVDPNAERRGTLVNELNNHFRGARHVAKDIAWNSGIFSQDLLRRKEENRDHGWPHERRLYDYGSVSLERSAVELGDVEFVKPLVTPFGLAVRTHDISQQENGRKFLHNKLGALFAYAAIPAIAEHYDLTAWDVHATVGMDLYHSRPERLQHESYIPSALELRNLVYEELGKADLDLGSYFPAIQPYLTNLDDAVLNSDNPFYSVPSFSEDERKMMEFGIRWFASVDKLDSVFPPLTSRVRSLLTPVSRGRPYFVPYSRNLSPFEECRLRIKEGGGEPRDDFSRSLFEGTRDYRNGVSFSTFTTAWFASTMNANLQCSVSIGEALLSGQHRVVTLDYARRRRSLKDSAWRKGNYSTDLERAEGELSEEEREVYEILNRKRKLSSIEDYEVERMKALVKCARRETAMYGAPMSPADFQRLLNLRYDSLVRTDNINFDG